MTTTTPAPSGISGETTPAGPGVAASSTPTLRALGRRASFWVVAAVGAIAVSVIATVVAGGGSTGGPPLAADSPAPAGGMALAEVLRQQGVDVTAAHSLDEAHAAVTADSTLFYFDPMGYLTGEQVEDVLRLAPRTVIVAPDFQVLDALGTLGAEIGFAGISGEDSLSAQCTVPAARQAETLTPGGETLRLIDPESTGLTGCFPSGDDTYSVIEWSDSSRTVTLVAPSAIFQNDTITGYGNAALGLNLLGQSDSLVWYLPTLADVAPSGPPSLGELTPGWVTPVIVLLLSTTLVAGIWRGRRFGPLVAENLPVVVRASETMEGRARLYARSSARLRAIDALRMGTLQRLAVQVGLPRSATVADIVRSVSALLERPAAAVGDILVDAVPATDRELMQLSDRLAELEQAVARATSLRHTPASLPPTPSDGRMVP